ncbi:MAG TPA: alkaline phosphatase [Pirellulales bacterium]|jgi:alkaline phosphatase
MSFFRSGRWTAFLPILLSACTVSFVEAADFLRDLQSQAVTKNHAPWGYWGTDPGIYTGWTNHSNRLIPAYTFGISMEDFQGDRSVYRDAKRLEQLYGRLPDQTLNPHAEYLDQTDIARLQRAALVSGKKYVVLIIFDGMDWQTTQAAAIYKAGKVGYTEGRGTGLHFQDYRGTKTDFGYFVSSPASDATSIDVNAQTVLPATANMYGGYNAQHGGAAPWAIGDDPAYLIGRSRECPHAVTDSAASATSLCAGIKTYNVSINVGPHGRQVAPVSHEFQSKGYSVGVITSVPISHATPACAYAHNVSRDDFQDLTRDLLGLPSVAHRHEPLSGVDVLLGAGWGEVVEDDRKQGTNFIPGNKYIASDDLQRIDVRHGGNYRVVQREAGRNGPEALATAADDAGQHGQRLFGFFGAKTGHLPFATADGQYDPAVGVRKLAEVYSAEDRHENPTLADMTRAALRVLSTNPRGFWLMVEAGEVDWANHDDNLDNSIGAVMCGDAAFHAVTDWVEEHNCWNDTAVILTADHGHYLHLTDPKALLEPAPPSGEGR